MNYNALASCNGGDKKKTAVCSVAGTARAKRSKAWYPNQEWGCHEAGPIRKSARIPHNVVSLRARHQTAFHFDCRRAARFCEIVCVPPPWANERSGTTGGEELNGMPRQVPHRRHYL